MGLVDLLVHLALGGQVWVSADPAWVRPAVGLVRAVVEVLAAV